MKKGKKKKAFQLGWRRAIDNLVHFRDNATRGAYLCGKFLAGDDNKDNGGQVCHRCETLHNGLPEKRQRLRGRGDGAWS